MNAWWIAARPKTLPAALAPVIAGTAVALHLQEEHWPSATLALITALLLQIAANFANDALDFRKGADTEHRLGPTRVTASGLISERTLLIGTGIVLLAAIGTGLPLAIRGGWPIFALGIAALVCAVAYTGGPFPISYLGLGEVFVFIFFGLAAVAGTAYIQTGEWSTLGWLVAIPIGALAVGILIVNNLRDIETDRQAGKHTIAVRIGAARTRHEYGWMLQIAVIIPIVLGLTGWLGWWWLLTILWWPFAGNLYQKIREHEGRALNPVLAETGRALLLYSLILSLALILAEYA